MNDKLRDRIKLIFLATAIVFTLLTVWFFTTLSFNFSESAPGLFGGSCSDIVKKEVICGYPVKSTSYLQISSGKFPEYDMIERKPFYSALNYAYWLLIYAAIAALVWFVVTKFINFVRRLWIKRH